MLIAVCCFGLHADTTPNELFRMKNKPNQTKHSVFELERLDAWAVELKHECIIIDICILPRVI